MAKKKSKNEANLDFLREKGREFSRDLTQRATRWELLFKVKLESWWIDFTFQHPVICNKKNLFILDFYLPQLGLAVELDGAQHYTKEGKKKDRRRTSCLKKERIHVLRIPNSLVNTITEVNFKSLIAPYVSNR